MAANYRLVTKRFFIALNVVAALLFLTVCLVPYFDVSHLWPISILSLGFAFLFLLLVLFVFFWAVLNPRFILISLLTLALGFKSIAVFFAANRPSTFRYTKAPGAFRVASWNVARFLEQQRNSNPASQKRLKMLELIKQQNADVLCFQEFFSSTDARWYNNIEAVKALGYPYFYYAWDADGFRQWFGQAIFSRYPIIDSGRLHYPPPTQPETLLHADIKIGRDTVRFFTTHLQSVKFRQADFERIREIKNRDDSLLQNSRSILYKLKTATILRAQQAEIVKNELNDARRPFVITGDFNDVPNSYAYATISKGLQDAFLKKGFGVGRTFYSLSPTLRIDHILTTPDIDVLQFNRLVKQYSDHYMIVADLKLKK